MFTTFPNSSSISSHNKINTTSNNDKTCLPNIFLLAYQGLLSKRIENLIQNLQTSNGWNSEAGDIAPSLIVRLPGWPKARALSIMNERGIETIRITPPNGREEFPPIKLLLHNKHYSSITNHGLIPIKKDGDCFYNAVLACLNEKEKIDLLSNPYSADAATQLRYHLIHYICAHPKEVEELLDIVCPYNASGNFYNPKNKPKPPSSLSSPSFAHALYQTSLQLLPLYSKVKIEQIFPSNTSPIMQAEIEEPTHIFDTSKEKAHAHTSDSKMHTLSDILQSQIKNQVHQATHLPFRQSGSNHPLKQECNPHIAPSIYALSNAPSSTQITPALLENYKEWYKNIPPLIKKERPIFNILQTHFLSYYGVSADELNKYVMRNGNTRIRGKQFIKKEQGIVFHPITIGILKEWSKNSPTETAHPIISLARFAQNHHVFLNDLEKFCNPANGLTLRGKQTIALYEGQIFRPITQNIVEKYLAQYSAAERLADTSMRTVEAFSMQENILLEEFEKCLALNGHLAANHEAKIRHTVWANYTHPPYYHFDPLRFLDTHSALSRV